MCHLYSPLLFTPFALQIPLVSALTSFHSAIHPNLEAVQICSKMLRPFMTYLILVYLKSLCSICYPLWRSLHLSFMGCIQPYGRTEPRVSAQDSHSPGNGFPNSDTVTCHLGTCSSSSAPKLKCHILWPLPLSLTRQGQSIS